MLWAYKVRNIFRIIWFLSVVGAISAILVTYTDLTESVRMAFGYGIKAITRDQYFYFTMSGLFVVNGLFYMLGKMLSGLPPAFLPIVNKTYWLGSKYRYRKAKAILFNWAIVTAVVVNYWFIVFVLGIRDPNSFDPKSRPLPEWAPLLGYVLIGTLVLPYLRFYINKISLLFEQENQPDQDQ